MPIFNVEYDSNNSGGDWWLKDKDWKKLEEAGWHIHWVKDNPYDTLLADLKRKEGRFLGALATAACIDIDAQDDNEAEEIAQLKWQNVTGKNGDEKGCSCCGRPHYFYANTKGCDWKQQLIDKDI